MKKAMGLWIDHREAIIVALTPEGDKTLRVASEFEQDARVSDTAQIHLGEDMLDRRRLNHLKQYYDTVAATLREADELLIFGPGQAKEELKRRLTSSRLADRVVAVETAARMTDRQIVAKVRRHFQV